MEIFQKLTIALHTQTYKAKRVMIFSNANFFVKLLFAFAMCVALAYSANAEDTLSHHGGCGLTPAYLRSMGVDSTGAKVLAGLTPPATFPTSAIETCGKYIIYYEDLRPGAPLEGFNEGGGKGVQRRNTLCAVLTYMQSVFDYSLVGGYIRLHVDTSYSNLGFPIPVPLGDSLWYGSLGVCSPFYDKAAATVSGALINGFVHDYITKGIDNAPFGYHANLQMNFAIYKLGITDFTRHLSIYSESPVDFYNNTGSVTPCQFDLFSTLLHLNSHSLGWFSWHDSSAIHAVPASVFPVSNYDTGLFTLDDPKVTTNPFLSMIKVPALPAVPRSGVVINGKLPPYNANVSIGGLSHKPPYFWIYNFSHMLGDVYTSGTRITPGDRFKPVMGVPVKEGDTTRQYTKIELIHFRDVIGLTLKSSFTGTHATLLNNKIPYSTKMHSDPYNFLAGDIDIAETLPADYTIFNNIGTSLSINLNSDISLKDDDGDPISVMAGTLVNFRGCSSGGNNHNQLSLNTTGDIITYTPRSNFYGRAQFGFNLYDGKEKGAFVIYTIDVKPGSNVGVAKGGNIVVNGDFEEGTETKVQGINESVNNSFAHSFLRDDRQDLLYRGRLNNGTYMSDGHPFDVSTNYIYGTAIRNSFSECGSASLGRPFGHPANSFPWPEAWYTGFGRAAWGAFTYLCSDGFPDSKITGSANDRYQPMGQDGILLNLTDTLKKCARYILEFDAVRTYDSVYIYPSTEKVTVGFTNSALISGLTGTTMIRSSKYDFPSIKTKKWEHFKTAFSYCADTPAHVLFLDFDGAFANNEIIATTLLDNVSVKEVDLSLSIKIIDSVVGSCKHMLLAGPYSTGCPSMTYEWRNAAGAVVGTSRGVSVYEIDTAVYTVTVFDGCQTAHDTVTVYPCRCAPVSVFKSKLYTPLAGTIATALPPGDYYVNGDLFCASSLSFQRANVLIQPGLKISVAPGVLLTVDSSHLFTCPDTNAMWKGIELLSGASQSGKIDVKNNSLIEDALVGINAKDIATPASGNVISVINSTFNRNQTDIAMSNYKPSSPAVLPIIITNNLFTARMFNSTNMPGYPKVWTSTGNLKAELTPVDAKPSYNISRNYAAAACKDTGIRSLVCIKTSDVGSTSVGIYQSELVIGTGNASTDFNLLDNHRYGMMFERTNTKLLHNHFININRRMEPTAGSWPTPENGMGVMAKSTSSANNRLNMKPSPVGNLTNKFHDCFIGIYTENVSKVNIDGARITTSNRLGATVASAAYPSEVYSGYGMMLYNDGNLNSDSITNNSVSNCNVGIHVNILNPPNSAVVFIKNNTVAAKNPFISATYTTNQFLNQAMELYGNRPIFMYNSFLNANSNTITNAFNGIVCSGFTSMLCSLTNNSITLYDNFIPGVTDKQYGIAANANSNMLISENKIKTPALNPVFELGDRIRGISAAFNVNLLVCGNTDSNLGRGFEFAAGSSQPGTRWIANTMYNNYAGMFLASDIGEQGAMRSYVMYPFGYVWSATKNVWAGSWGGTKTQTTVWDRVDTRLSKLWVKSTSSEMPTINGNRPYGYAYPFRYQFSSSSPMSIAETSTEAYCDINNVSSKTSPIPTTTGPAKPIGALIVADGLGYDSTFRKKQWMNQYAFYELGHSEPDLRDSSAIFDQFIDTLESTRFGWLSAINAALSINDTSLAEVLLASPAAKVGKVIVSSDIVISDYDEADNMVQNYVDYYSLYLKYIKSNLNGNDTANIEMLAAKCPATSGAVVYLARSLRQRLTFQRIFYDDDSCEYLGGQYRIAPKNDELQVYSFQEDYKLFPNPNSGQFAIKRDETTDEDLQVKVYNSLGMLLSQKTAHFSNQVANFSAEEMIPGLYLICIEKRDKSIVCLKFVVK